MQFIKEHPEVKTNVEAVTRGLENAQLIKTTVADLDGKSVTPTIDVNIEPASAKIADLHRQVEALSIGIQGALAFFFNIRSQAQDTAIQHVVDIFELGGVVDRPTVALMGEHFKREAVVPEQASLARQMELLDEIGVLSKLEAQFSASEQARFASLGSPLNLGGPTTSGSALTLDGLAARIEEAVSRAVRQTQPNVVQIPGVRDPNELSRLVVRRLVRR